MAATAEHDGGTEEKDGERPDLNSPVPVANQQLSSRNAFASLDESVSQPGTDLTISPKIPLPGPPPDGGLQAWLQILGGFAIFFNTWGLIATYGVFQSYYLTLPTLPDNPSAIAWIGSLYSATTFLTGFVTGPIFDRGFLRTMLLTGTLTLVFAFMMISLSDRLYQLILAQGICAGIGSGILFSMSSPLLVQWWRRRLGMANGIVASGAAVAGVVYPIAFRKLLPAVGFPWAVRILGFIALVTLLPANIFLKRRIPPGRPRAWLDATILKDRPFQAYMCATLLGVIGLYSMLFFLSSFVAERHLLSEDMSFYILPILNAGSLFGRILPNLIADRYGALNVAPGGCFICSLLIFCMIAVDSGAGVIVMAVIFGFFSAMFIALPGLASATLIKDKSLMGTRMGMSLAFGGMGALAGGPGGGSVMSYGDDGHDWNALWVYGGVASAVSGLFYLLARQLHLKTKQKEIEEEEGEKHGNKKEVEHEASQRLREESDPEGMLAAPAV